MTLRKTGDVMVAVNYRPIVSMEIQRQLISSLGCSQDYAIDQSVVNVLEHLTFNSKSDMHDHIAAKLCWYCVINYFNLDIKRKMCFMFVITLPPPSPITDEFRIGIIY